MARPKLSLSEISDLVIRRNFEKIRDFFLNETPLWGFRFYTISFTGAVSNSKYPHQLGFLPQDILLTSLTGSGQVTFNYGQFDTTNLDITTTGPCVVRFFAGTYQPGTQG